MRWINRLFRARWRFELPPMRSLPPPSVIRPMEVRDRGACETIYRLNEPKRFPPNYFDLFADKLREGGSSVLVAEIDGVVRGLGAIRIVRYPILDVASLTFGMVHPEYQNRGLGTALLLAR